MPDIKPVIYREGGFATQPFAFGGEEGPEAFDAGQRYRSGLQNYVIDTGDDVILVDTGLPAGTPEESPDETTAIYTGHVVTPTRRCCHIWIIHPRRGLLAALFILRADYPNVTATTRWCHKRHVGATFL